MERMFDIRELDVDRLLQEWRWLCPEPMAVVARNGFGDLFLRTLNGRVFWLDVTSGMLNQVAESELQFSTLLKEPGNRASWFSDAELESCAKRGLNLDNSQCIGFKTPLVFAESAAIPDNAYVADLYEHVSFLGELHRQIADKPDGKRVRLRISST
jgi:hypothetical protein